MVIGDSVNHGFQGVEFRKLSLENKVKEIFQFLPPVFQIKDIPTSRSTAYKIARYMKDHGLVSFKQGRSPNGRFGAAHYTKAEATVCQYSGKLVLDHENLFCSVYSDLSSVHSSQENDIAVDSVQPNVGSLSGGGGMGEGADSQEIQDEFELDYHRKREAAKKRCMDYIEKMAEVPIKKQRNKLRWEEIVDYEREEDGLPLNYNIPKERACFKRLAGTYGEDEAIGFLRTLRTIRLMDNWWKENVDYLPSSLTPRIIELVIERRNRMYGRKPNN